MTIGSRNNVNGVRTCAHMRAGTSAMSGKRGLGREWGSTRTTKRAQGSEGDNK